MSNGHLHSWQERLAEAIQSFPLWGRLRPSTQRGHAITAFAFESWSQGALGVHVCASEAKSTGPYFYACAFQNKTFEPLFVDWKAGWCLDDRASHERFRDDVGSAGYSFSYGRLSDQTMAETLARLVPKDQLLVTAMVMHLEATLGAFDWAPWREAAKLHYGKGKSRASDGVIAPVDIGQGKFAVVSKDPFCYTDEWPPGLTSEQLCTYLGSGGRQQASPILFFTFQDHLDQYMKNNPECRWTPEDSTRLVSLFSTYPRKAHTFFELELGTASWPKVCTRVIAPHFSPYIADFLGGMEYGDTQLDKAWFVASHGPSDAKTFGMLDTVFQGKSQLNGDEDLRLGVSTFRVAGVQGDRGTLLSLETSENAVSACWDVLRQARAYCGGILAVSHSLVQEDPLFWQARFNNKEVAALLDEQGNATQAHPHYAYQKKPVDLGVGCYQSEVLLERSLFQEDPKMWRGGQYSDLRNAWGWTKCMDSLAYRSSFVPEYPDLHEDRYTQKRNWSELLEHWLVTMHASEAGCILGALRSQGSWPIDEEDWKRVAEHYLAETPSLLALCEMMDFSADGVLDALRRVDVRRAATPLAQEYHLPVNDLL